MKVIVGLGNPGSEYEGTRHNAGWAALDALAPELGSTYWKDECGAKVSHCKDEVFLVKPQSFMNLSGGPVKNVLEKYEAKVDDLIVIHDDMDIEPGSIRVRKGGSAAGHNGLKSLFEKLGTQDFVRVRIGIGRPSHNGPYTDYVLDEPKGKAKEDFEAGCSLAAEATIYLLYHTLEETQQKYN
ncbi:MAG: aminoacyl-tRNA hydrolase [Coriobacteriia bacterium]|nr:aminoacyl-tRNA hydrolase [Coriobacteriia bacterium]